jgi:toxin-antitoxin system PIN domain toxin
MILIDANLLLFAHNTRAPQHDASRRWLESVLSGPDLVRFGWVTLWAFLRIATNPSVFENPLSIAEGDAAVTSWLGQPRAAILEPADRHWAILRALLVDAQARGPMVSDAALAALAIEHGATLCTTDRDFARFPGLSWKNPLES